MILPHLSVLALLLAFLRQGAHDAAAQIRATTGTAGTTATTAAELQARIAELANPEANLADNETVLIRELDKLDEEAARIRGAISQADWADVRRQLDVAKTALEETAASIANLNCAEQAEDINSLLSSSFSKISDIQFLPFRPPSFSALVLQIPPDLDDAEKCSAAQKQISDRIEERSTFFTTVDRRITEEEARHRSLAEVGTRLLDAIKLRRDAIQEKLNQQSPQQQISSSLWIIMIVIGGISVLTILVVKLFDPPLQMEWVASGQVIQFVTVMILLSVVMALGLSDILHEETLGTLLGAVAGYVLAQGVGRAAARDTARSAGLDNRTMNRGDSSTPSAGTNVTPAG